MIIEVSPQQTNQFNIV